MLPGYTEGMRVRCPLAICLLLAFTGPVYGADSPTTWPVPLSDVQKMDARELGALYRPADASKYLAAHALSERFFAAINARPAPCNSTQPTSGSDSASPLRLHGPV